MHHTESGFTRREVKESIMVTGYSLLLRMRGVHLRFTVNSGMCAQLWRQFLIAYIRLDFNSTKKGAGWLEKFYRDKHPVREILCVLLA